MTYTDYITDILETHKRIPANNIHLLEKIKIEFSQLFPGEYDLVIEKINEDTVLSIIITFYDVEEQIEWRLRYG